MSTTHPISTPRAGSALSLVEAVAVLAPRHPRPIVTVEEVGVRRGRDLGVPDVLPGERRREVVGDDRQVVGGAQERESVEVLRGERRESVEREDLRESVGPDGRRIDAVTFGQLAHRRHRHGALEVDVEFDLRELTQPRPGGVVEFHGPAHLVPGRKYRLAHTPRRSSPATGIRQVDRRVVGASRSTAHNARGWSSVPSTYSSTNHSAV